MRTVLARVLLLFTAAPLTACALGSGTVTRIADGREFEGRAISAEAYGAYARGALLEAAGDDQRALEAYQAALSEDGDSPEIHARLGAVRCRLARSPKDAVGASATRSLKRAVELDPNSSTAWAETAHCEALRGRGREAYQAALRAAQADPSTAASALLVSALAEAAGEHEQARAWLDELVARRPESREAWAALAAFAARHGDLGRALRARAGLSELGLSAGAHPAQELEAALGAADLETARSAATRLRLAPGELATQLAERGQYAAAAEQATLVLRADPEDANAWVTRLFTADLARDQAEFERALANVPTAPSGLSPAAARLHGQLLERLVGPDARGAWLEALAK